MPITKPLPDLDDLLADMGAGGSRISGIDAGEAAVGTIAVCVGWELDLSERFPDSKDSELPLPAPALAGRTLPVTGSGRRLRRLAQDPPAGIGRCASTGTDGRPPRTPHRATGSSASPASSPPTWPSTRTGWRAAPSRSRPWCTPSPAPDPTSATSPPTAPRRPSTPGLREAQAVLWSKHGVVARSDLSVAHAVDRVEYAETGARTRTWSPDAGPKA
ncbi:hypothetical protein [Streptomyces sp. H51]|uniref:hypothetical protein n=1 Tax=Streptomyces sp. H51 TaxID=3111770 RepID=UPI002D77557B|nr:hypothetical protein [Streptomyces sp. H51]